MKKMLTLTLLLTAPSLGAMQSPAHPRTTITYDRAHSFFEKRQEEFAALLETADYDQTIPAHEEILDIRASSQKPKNIFTHIARLSKDNIVISYRTWRTRNPQVMREYNAERAAIQERILAFAQVVEVKMCREAGLTELPIAERKDLTLYTYKEKFPAGNKQLFSNWCTALCNVEKIEELQAQLPQPAERTSHKI